MTTIRQFYADQVESQWPEVVPALTASEAQRAARRLYRFAFKRKCTLPIVVTSGRRYSYINAGKLRVNPSRGWKEMVHELSHSFFARLNPGAKPHDRPHGFLERTMIQYVIAQGWLTGKLKVKTSEPKDKRVVKYQRTLAGIERWNAKLRRAEKALSRLNKRRKYYERQGVSKMDTKP